jgi:hypothetical protein
MKEIKLLFIGLLFLMFNTIAISQDRCEAPNPHLVNTTNNAAWVAWSSVPEALSYTIEVYQEGIHTAIKVIETEENFIVVSDLEPSQHYKVVVGTNCPNGRIESEPIEFDITVEDDFVLIPPPPPGTYRKVRCQKVTERKCFKKGERIKDFMKYGGNTFTATDAQGRIFTWGCEQRGNELIFKEGYSFGIELGLIKEKEEVIGINFKDDKSKNINLWTLFESKDSNGKPSFDIFFNADVCIDIEKCVLLPADYPEYLAANPNPNLIKNTLAFTPNPVIDNVLIQINIVESKETTIAIYNSSGQLIETLYKGLIDKGSHAFSWESNTLMRGVYFLKLHTPTNSIVKKMVKL